MQYAISRLFIDMDFIINLLCNYILQVVNVCHNRFIYRVTVSNYLSGTLSELEIPRVSGKSLENRRGCMFVLSENIFILWKSWVYTPKIGSLYPEKREFIFRKQKSVIWKSWVYTLKIGSPYSENISPYSENREFMGLLRKSEVCTLKIVSLYFKNRSPYSENCEFILRKQKSVLWKSWVYTKKTEVRTLEIASLY